MVSVKKPLRNAFFASPSALIPVTSNSVEPGLETKIVFSKSLLAVALWPSKNELLSVTVMASMPLVAPSSSVITIGMLPLTTMSPLVSSQVGMNESLLCAGIPMRILPSASAFSGTRIFSLGVMLSLSVCPMLYLSPSSTIKISLCFPPNAISPLAAFSRACAGRLMDDAFEKSIDARLDSSSDFSGLQTLNFTLVFSGMERALPEYLNSLASTRFTFGVMAISLPPSLLLIVSLAHSGKSASFGLPLSNTFAPAASMTESTVVVKTKSHLE